MPTITDFSRITIDYTADDGNLLNVPIRTAVAAASSQPESTTPHPGRPARWVLRHVYLVTPTTGAVTHRKKVVIGSPDHSWFNGTFSGAISLDGVNWRIEGRIGEKRVNAG